MKMPCVKDCPYRTPECHATCESYLAWYDWNEKRRAEIAKAKKADKLKYERLSKSFTKWHKNHNNHK